MFRRFMRASGLHGLAAIAVTAGLSLPGVALLAQPAAAANSSSAELDQCTNGSVSPLSPQPCLGSGTAASVAIPGINGGAKTSYKDWTNGNGNVNGAKSHWQEGEFIPYRTVLSGLGSGSHTLTFSYNTVGNGGHAIDYLGSYDATETTSSATASSTPGIIHANNNSPCQDLVLAGQIPQSQCGSAYNASGQQTSPATPVATTAAPAENLGSGTGGEQGCGGSHGIFSGTQQAGTIDLFGPAGSTIGPATIGTGGDNVLTATGQCTTTVTLKFSIPSSLGANQSIVIAWSGHVASQQNWGAGNSASFTGGSAPYQMSLGNLDGASTGSQNRALATSAVYFIPAISTTVDVNGTACSGSPCGVPLAATVNDSATMTNAAAIAGGTVTYSLFPNGTCSGTATSTHAVTVTNAAVPNSPSFTPTAGSYSYQATYSGDTRDVPPPAGPCEPFAAGQAGSSAASTVVDAGTGAAWSGTEAAGSSAYDTAAVTVGGGFTPTGTVTYTYFTSGDCSAGGSVNKVVTLNADGSVPASATVGPLAAGSYSFQVAYSGDVNYTGSVGPCVPFTVNVKPLVVSLTFDDGNLDQYTNALPILQQYGVHGTFYIITGYIGNLSGYMTLPDLQAIYNSGNEIAAHTVLHAHLTQVSTDEATRETCQSRNTLLNWGFPVTDFAYPYSETNASVENITQQCGLNSARLSEDLKGPFSCLSGCPLTDPIPPADPYFIKTPDSLQDTWSLSDLENLVSNAEGNGGWLPLVFHHICDNDCDQYSISPANFSAFLAWLQTQNVSVQTVNQVMGGPVNPPVSAPQVSPAAPGVNGVANPSLETADANNAGFPYCWRASTGGTNDASFAETSNAHTGSVAETITINNYTSGDAKLITVQDLGQCAPAVVPGDAYVASGWYKSTTPTRLVFYYRDTVGGWHFWTQSPQFAASGSWAQAAWSPPAIPSNATALSFGLNIQAAGTLTTDDFSLVDTGGPPANPSVTITGPAAGSTLSGQTTFTSNASSAIGIARVDYIVNGAVVATSTSAPFTATWDSSTVGDGPVTITARATDIDGNQATSASVSATISNAASRGGNMLANASLETATNGSLPDCWQLGSSGTNTATWTRTSNAHTGSWAENVAITSYTSGDRKLVTSQGANACSPRVNAGGTYNLGGWYESNQPTRIVAFYQNSSGSWVFWTQSPQFAASSAWAHATWTTPAVPAGATALSFGLNLAAVGSLTTDDYTMTSN